MNELAKSEDIEFKKTPIKVVDGSIYYLGEAQRIICRVFVETGGNVLACSRALWSEKKKKLSPQTIRRWLDRYPMLITYLKELEDKKAKVAGFTEDDWKLKALDHFDGKKRMDAIDVTLWKEWGNQVVNKGSGPGVQNNVQINFTQKDGNP